MDITMINPLVAVVAIAIILAICVIGLPIAFKFFIRSRFFNRFVLSMAEKGENGFIGTNASPKYVGKTGIVLTPLRPAGSALIDGIKLDVVSEGTFIEKGTRIKVIKVEGPRIVVEKSE